jgi:hypothetical protein
MPPRGQNSSVGIYNITNLGPTKVNIIVSLNATVSCFNFTLSNSSSCSAGLNLTASNQTAYYELNPSASAYLWAFQHQATCLGTDIPRFKVFIEAG